jgi:hypothetical protein
MYYSSSIGAATPQNYADIQIGQVFQCRFCACPSPNPYILFLELQAYNQWLLLHKRSRQAQERAATHSSCKSGKQRCYGNFVVCLGASTSEQRDWRLQTQFYKQVARSCCMLLSSASYCAVASVIPKPATSYQLSSAALLLKE